MFKGARQITYSRDLNRYRARDKTDEEFAQEAPRETIGTIPAAIFREICARGLDCEVLEAAERGGWDEVLRFLGCNGITWIATDHGAVRDGCGSKRR